MGAEISVLTLQHEFATVVFKSESLCIIVMNVLMKVIKVLINMFFVF